MRSRVKNFAIRVFPRFLLRFVLPRQFSLYGHYISNTKNPVVLARYQYPGFSELEAVILWARRSGYRFVSLQEYCSCENKTEKMILLSFDDGFKNVIDEIHPFLKKHEVPYAIFILSRPLRDENFQMSIFTSEGKMDFLSRQDILDLKKDGVHIGFHTDTHKRINENLSLEEIHGEISASNDIAEVISEPKAFAYPFAGPKDWKAYDCIIHEYGFTVVFDTRGELESSGGHFFRISMDSLPGKRRSSLIFYNLKKYSLFKIKETMKLWI